MSPVQAYRNAVAGQRMGHYEPPDVAAVRGRSIQQLQEAIREARLGLREIEELREHACTWSDDDRCNVCGADGRA